MPSEDDRWFVAERGEALAGLLLTSRGDVRIQSKKATGDGVDFLVAVDEGESLSTRLFVVRVKGTTSSDESESMRGVNEVFQPHSQSISLPECVFVVNIRDNRARYAWVAEPLVEDSGAKLRFPPPGGFQPLDRAAIDDIVDRVKEWYDILHQQLVPAPT